MIDHSTNVPPKEVFGNPDAFRAELAKLEPEQPTVEPSPDNIPEDDINMSHESTPGEENIPEESTEESVEEHNPEPSIDAAETSGKEKSHLIPKSRFNQEIEKRKALEEQLAKEREDRIRFETQLQMLDQQQQHAQLQQQQQNAAAQQEVLDNIDPLDTDTYNYAKREISALKEQLANVTRETEQRTKEMIYTNRVTTDEAKFQQSHPDFNDAFAHVQKVEMDIAKNLLGNEAAAQSYVADRMRAVLTTSVDSGKNAAETIYNMAKTYGYNKTSRTEKTVPSIDVEAVAKNMARTANTSNIGNSGTFGNVPTDIAAAMDKNGRVDVGLFHKQLERLQKNM
jgi:hypothetical protein